jgi:hypothetical protein
MKEVIEGACGLDMPPGLHGVDYKQKFVKAPLSEHPSKAPSQGKEVPANDEAMKISLGC